VVNRHGKITRQVELESEKPFIDGDVVDNEILADLLKKVMKKGQVSLHHAAICLPEKMAYSREYILPRLPVSEIQEAISWQLSTIFPFKPEEIYTDWKLLEESDEGSRVVVVAISRQLLDSIREVCEQASIKPISFEPSTSALARLIKMDKASTIILEIDKQGASASLVQHGVSSLTTTTSFSSATEPEEILGNLATAITGIMKRSRSNETAKEQWDICLTGEKAAGKLAEILSKKVEVPCHLLPIEAVEPAYHVAYIAAFSAIQPPESEKTINLLPDNLKDEYRLEAELVQAKTATTLGIVISAIALVVAIGANMVGSLLGLQTNQENMVAPATNQQTTLNIPLLMQKAQKINMLQSIKNIPSSTMTDVFAILNNTDIRQYTYDVSKKEMRISIAGVDRSTLFDIKNALEATGKIAKVNIPLSALSSEGNGDMVLSIQIKDAIK